MDLKEQEVLGENAHLHWYYRAKSAAMLRMLHGTPIDTVLDVGAGSGFFSRILLDRTSCASALCVDPNYPADTLEYRESKPIHFVRAAARFDGRLVLMMDVLEHVADDTAMLADYVAKLRPGTRILITVPAMPWMWSGHDVFLEHYRRYTLGSVEQLVLRTGLRPVQSCYFFGLTLPAAAGVRLWRRLLSGGREPPASDMRAYGAFLNNFLWRICQLELAFFRRNRIAGLSVFALAEVPAAPAKAPPAQN